jgi:hypothetical protein
VDPPGTPQIFTLQVAAIISIPVSAFPLFPTTTKNFLRDCRTNLAKMDVKPDALELDKVKTNDSGTVELKVEHVSTFDTKQTKALLRKIDRHLIPFLSLLYLLSFLE